MVVQIEITTHCNFECFYRAGRDMPQKHMPFEVFLGVLDRLAHARPAHVNLQGEGEPTTHPRFWDMAGEVRRRGWVPYTITNGSCGKIERIARHFPVIGVSVDTLDAREAERIGRYKLGRVLANMDRLLARMGPDRLILHTVDYGQPLAPLREFARAKGIEKHVVQPLQVKHDYARRYPDRLPVHLYRPTYRCQYVERPLMRYYNIDGVEMPCCYIKDAADFLSVAHIRESLARRDVPRSCMGCSEIFRPIALQHSSTNAPPGKT
jgi:molybdenum cofactor biosynthesis enzyme MoaA